MKIPLLMIAALLLPACLWSQEPSKPSLTFGGYLELYYGYDLAGPGAHQRPGFIYSYNRHNEFALNLGMLRASVNDSSYRINFALGTGTYMQANYATEPSLMQYLFEASAGIRLSRNHGLWLDAGIFPSHIGFESALGRDCHTLTRSMLADNSPYYESGAKIGFTPAGGKWFMSLLLLNGWQRITRIKGEQIPAIGHQVTFTPRTGFTLNSSSFIGRMKPDTVSMMRYFHNFYGIIDPLPRLSFVLGFDIGAQESRTGKAFVYWYSPVLIARFRMSEHWATALRGEIYSDRDETIIRTGTANGFQTAGYSINFDYTVSRNVLWRTEARMLRSRDKIFLLNNSPSRDNYFLSTSLAVSF